MIDSYEIPASDDAGFSWRGGREAMLRFGPSNGPIVIASPALFEEANRTRAFLVTILRELAARGIASALPDLPGTGESTVALADLHPWVWRAAFAEVVRTFGQDRSVYTLSIRGGALFDGWIYGSGAYLVSPIEGDQLVRELIRAGRLGRPDPDPEWEAAVARIADRPIDRDTPYPPIEIAGNIIPGLFLAEISASKPYDPAEEEGWPVRIVRLESESAPADAKFPGAPQWRRAEPDNDPALAALLADDIAAWVRQCEG